MKILRTPCSHWASRFLNLTWILIWLVLMFLPQTLFAQRYGPGGPSSTGDKGQTPIGETQSRRSAERFNIIDWIRTQNATKAAQDSKYGRGGGGSSRGPYPDFV